MFFSFSSSSFIDARVSLWSFVERFQCCLYKLFFQLKSLLNGDRWIKDTETGTAVETLLTSDRPLLKDALHKMQGWYKTVSNSPLYPTRMTQGGPLSSTIFNMVVDAMICHLIVLVTG